MQLPCLRRLPALCRIALCVLALSIVISLGGAFPAAAQDGNILVFAAASLRNALEDVNAQWRKDNGKSARISYAGSSALARPIERGAQADGFISANVGGVGRSGESRVGEGWGVRGD